MNQFKEQIKVFYIRDLKKLADEIENVPDDSLWKATQGITNSCGVLTQHLTGNLNHYIGAGLANTGYQRDREREFTNTGISGEQLITEIRETISVIEKALTGLDEAQLNEPFPLYDSEDFNVSQMLIHLFGHFNYHLGQVNYLRRILAP